jgi:hypothetical protein
MMKVGFVRQSLDPSLDGFDVAWFKAVRAVQAGQSPTAVARELGFYPRTVTPDAIERTQFTIIACFQRKQGAFPAKTGKLLAKGGGLL